MFSKLQIGLKYTRPELAKLWGYEGFNGFSKGVFTPKGTNLIILFVTRIKQKSLTQYSDCISGGMLFWQGEEKGGSDQRIAEAGLMGKEIHLFYREIHHTPFEYMGQIVLMHPPKRNPKGPSDFVFNLAHDQSASDDLERRKAEIESLAETEREQIIKARLGQGSFREQLMDFWHRKCAVTEVDHPSVLVASHIKPWRVATNKERTDPFNGLLLLTQYDKLFDRGLITFDQQGSIQISKAFPESLWSRSGIAPHARIGQLTTNHLDYLGFHRKMVFVDQSKE
jgi:putative restriction endonuclease